MTTYITFVLDETGSMWGVRDDTIGGFNTYITDLRNNLKHVRFSLLKFNSNKKEWIHDKIGLSKVALLSEKTYIPTDGTPLWDAFGAAITRMETIELEPDDKVIISVLTDGMENSSVEFDASTIKALIEKHPDWAINFLGANMDAWDDVGRGLGMSRGATLTFSKDAISETYCSMSNATINFAEGKTSVDNFYTEGSTAKESEEEVDLVK